MLRELVRVLIYLPYGLALYGFLACFFTAVADFSGAQHYQARPGTGRAVGDPGVRFPFTYLVCHSRASYVLGR